MGDRVTYPSVDAMLEPTELAGLLVRSVESVVLSPVTTLNWSTTEAVFQSVHVDGEATPAAVIKRICWSQDWQAIATEDTRGREIAIWETGVLDRLPPAMGHAVRGAARFADGAAVLMDDLTAHLLPGDTDVTPARVRGVLRGMAAMHARFWEDPPIGELGAAMCQLEQRVALLSPASLRALGRVLPTNELVATFPDGWDRLPRRVDPGIARDLQTLADDPAPFVRALDGYPTTLLHGDLWIANVAWDGQRAIPIDWQPTAAPSGYDLAYFVYMLGGGPLHPDEAMAVYREMLAAELGPGVSLAWWDDHLDICIAAVVAAMAPVLALFSPDPHDPRVHAPWDTPVWWAERAARGLRLIGAA